ncbi:hypothetical protein AAG589_17470 [Isoptericola sp. F-RaC21]|uniref:hypothetical protein n=1 Tax=Isoptericola sp. F-RaC21 TaxID=3141452 RepID=UPI00315C066D
MTASDMAPAEGEVRLWAVPRDRVWLHCPRCDGPAFFARGRLSCRRCPYVHDGTPGAWCSCCHRWEGDVPVLGERVVRATLRCGVCGRRREAEQRVTGATGLAPVRCECGAAMTVVSSWAERAAGFDDGVDPIFGLRYYLARPCAGHLLWVANREHLDYLARFVAAGVRPGPQNEMGNRLPRWMLTAKHRAAVLAGLGRLRQRCDELESA